jgi:hypothetical protein
MHNASIASHPLPSAAAWDRGQVAAEHGARDMQTDLAKAEPLFTGTESLFEKSANYDECLEIVDA